MKKTLTLAIIAIMTLSATPCLAYSKDSDESHRPIICETTAEETTAAPTEEETIPAETTAAPTEEETIPAETTAAPTEEETIPAETTAAPTEEETIPAETTAAPTEIKTVIVTHVIHEYDEDGALSDGEVYDDRKVEETTPEETVEEVVEMATPVETTGDVTVDIEQYTPPKTGDISGIIWTSIVLAILAGLFGAFVSGRRNRV